MSDIQWVDVQAILIGSRFVDSKHLGLGDIRLTIDEQDRIVDYVAKLEARAKELEAELEQLKARLPQDKETIRRASKWV